MMNAQLKRRARTHTWFMGRAASIVVVVTLVGAVPLASSAQNNSSRIRTLAEIRYEGVIQQQWDTSCGAAALATLLTYDLNDPVTERSVATGMLHRTDPIRVRARGGFSLLNMQEYAEARGYEASGYGELSLDDLQSLLPAIVPVQFHGNDHFVVVRIIDRDRVWIADPAFGRRVISVPAFENAWQSKVAFVVAPK